MKKQINSRVILIAINLTMVTVVELDVEDLHKI